MPQRRFLPKRLPPEQSPLLLPLLLFEPVRWVSASKPHLSLARSGGVNITNPTLSNQINTAVNAQRDKTQSDINKFQYYPVVSIGLAYRF